MNAREQIQELGVPPECLSVLTGLPLDELSRVVADESDQRIALVEEVLKGLSVLVQIASPAVIDFERPERLERAITKFNSGGCFETMAEILPE